MADSDGEALSCIHVAVSTALWGISFSFPPATRYDSPPLHVSGSAMCVHASLRQKGFYRKGLQVEHPLT